MQQTCWSACLIPIRGSNLSQTASSRYLGCWSHRREKAKFSPSVRYCCQRNHFIWLPRVQQTRLHPSGCRGPKQRALGKEACRAQPGTEHQAGGGGRVGGAGAGSGGLHPAARPHEHPQSCGATQGGCKDAAHPQGAAQGNSFM